MALGSYRAFYLLNWLYRYFTDGCGLLPHTSTRCARPALFVPSFLIFLSLALARLLPRAPLLRPFCASTPCPLRVRCARGGCGLVYGAYERRRRASPSRDDGSPRLVRLLRASAPRVCCLCCAAATTTRS